MNLTLSAIVLVTLAIIAGIWALVLRIKKGARAEVVADVATATVETQKKMDEAEAAAKGEKVVDSLRRGGF